MSTIQSFMASATVISAEQLITAIDKIPADKRDWSAGGTARTALDQLAECIILNGYTVSMIHSRSWSDNNFQNYGEARDALTKIPFEELKAQLITSANDVAEAIKTVPDDALSVIIAMPWASKSLAEVLGYPYWNMTYHQGQINFIASILGTLD